MLFNSLEFIIFFIIVTSVYFFLPHKYRWFHLLAASCYFYMAFIPVYILILGGTIVVDYFAGVWIENANGTRRKLFLVLSLIANIGVLAVFKYYNFFVDNINALGFHFSFLKILLPIGLSFHTFQAMSYTIEVYRGNQKAEKHFGIYALYVMFYPQLVAGPIERPQHMLHQLYEKHDFNANDFFIGFKMMLWGMFKKVVIADRLAILVNTVYKQPQNYNGTMLLLATIFFSVQIYCDFSGYSSIAIGAAKAMGFKLMTNFNKPYEAKSIDEFWKRWHISLSTWFRDYLYISLGGNRVSIPRWYINLFIVFLISGFWHGANWTFIIWGALHGFYLVFSIITKNGRAWFNKLLHVKKKKFFHTFLQVTTTFLLVTFAWIFFRSSSVNDSFYIIKKIFSGNWGPLQDEIIFSKFSYILSFLLITFLFIAEHTFADKIIFAKLSEQFKRSIVFGITIMTIILILGIFQKLSFIYFQF
ncbi:MAG: rane bound O-acyl transferase family protein [Chitinophagaceae bacterium]|nr:rane bound O-acyl transferase family protein [Chitinophagaceae bacterium]MDB5222744.1 rane bound O-acyl transferase family protein [Chitinophagaceae bacterium]